MSAHARSSDRAPPALHTTRKRNPCDPCPFLCTPCVWSLSDTMMSSDSLLQMTCLISSRADLTLKSQCVMPSAPADEIDTQFNVLFSTFAILIVFSRYPPSALTATARSCGEYPSRNVLFSGARLLVSDLTWFLFVVILHPAVWHRRALVSPTVPVCAVSPHRDIATNMILAACSSHVLYGSCPRRAACADVLVSTGLCT